LARRCRTRVEGTLLNGVDLQFVDYTPASRDLLRLEREGTTLGLAANYTVQSDSTVDGHGLRVVSIGGQAFAFHDAALLVSLLISSWRE